MGFWFSFFILLFSSLIPKTAIAKQSNVAIENITPKKFQSLENNLIDIISPIIVKITKNTTTPTFDEFLLRTAFWAFHISKIIYFVLFVLFQAFRQFH